MQSNLNNGIALVFGSSGGIGNSIYKLLKNNYTYSKVYGFNRNSNPEMDLNNEKYLKSLADNFKTKNLRIKLLINTIGFLHSEKYLPEKKYQDISQEYLMWSLLAFSIAAQSKELY